MKDNQSNVNNGAMRPHHSLKILTIGFAIIALLLSLMATMAIHYTSQLADLNKKMYRHPFAVSNAVLTIDALIITMHRDMKDVVLARTSKDLELAVKRVKESELQVLKEFQIISKRFLGSSTKITSALKAFIDWRNIRQEVIELSRTGKYTQAAAITQGKEAVHVKLLLNHMDALVAFARNKAKAFYEQSQLTSEKITSQLWLWFIGIFSAALFVFLGLNYGIRKMEKALRKSQESYQDLYDNAPDMFVSVDPNTAEILQCNQTLVNKIGYSKEELIGKPIFFVYHPDCMDKVKKAFNQFVTTGQVANVELQLKRKDGSKIYVILNVTAAYDEKGNILHSRSIWRDITARKAAEDKLEHLAHYDALTDLPNRAFFQDYLHLLMAKTKRQTNLLAVSYLDLDGFKEVNDTFGHLVGDKLLITIAERLKETLREEDAIARLGGDEFICVFTGLKAPLEIVPILKRLLTVIAAPITINNHEMQVSTSIGSTFYPQKQEVEAEQLIRQADQAMYQAKLAGKNSYKFFNPQQDFAIKEQYKQLATIEKALKNDEFQLCYLPKVNMHTGKILGVEALIRWQTADKELLLPGQFLPYIENKAISIRLGEWVINAALKQMNDWQKSGVE